MVGLSKTTGLVSVAKADKKCEGKQKIGSFITVLSTTTYRISMYLEEVLSYLHT